jgi:hypothetical protein
MYDQKFTARIMLTYVTTNALVGMALGRREIT